MWSSLATWLAGVAERLPRRGTTEKAGILGGYPFGDLKDAGGAAVVEGREEGADRGEVPGGGGLLVALREGEVLGGEAAFGAVHVFLPDWRACGFHAAQYGIYLRAGVRGESGKGLAGRGLRQSGTGNS
jgi:hypothetical protein